MSEYSKIEELLSCPVCQDVSTPPIYQCQNGHIICSSCSQQLPSSLCPTCRVPLLHQNIRALMLEQMAEFVEVTCKNSKKGCDAKMKFIDFTSHICSFESVKWCQLLGCKCEEDVLLQELAEHVALTDAKHVHGILPKLVSPSEVSFDITQTIPIPNPTMKMIWEPFFIHDEKANKIFVICSKFDEQLLQWRCVEIIKTSTEEKVEDLEDKNIKISNKLNVAIKLSLGQDDQFPEYNWTGPIIPVIDLRKSSNLCDTSFNIPVQALSSFIKKAKESKQSTFTLQLKLNLLENYSSVIVDASPKQDLILEWKMYRQCHNPRSTLAPRSQNFVGVYCDNPRCPKENHIQGIRYMCLECRDSVVDLCEDCVATSGPFGQHEINHITVRMVHIAQFPDLSQFNHETTFGENSSIIIGRTDRIQQGYGARNIHEGVQCDACGMNPIIGVRYKCSCCNDIDLCEKCEAANIHSQHWLLRVVEHDPIKFFEMDFRRLLDE